MDDSYKIIISISRRRIAYEYWQRDGEDKLVPMPNGNWPAPLAFFCSDTGIIIGEDAMRAVINNAENAFDNYFERLTGDETYTIIGQTRPVRNLLLDTSEPIFEEFYKHVLYNSYGSLSDNRAKMPLMLVCESDIKSNDKAFLKKLFSDSGYSRVVIADYNNYISRYITQTLSKEYVCDKVVVAWTEGPDLTLSIFDVSGGTPIVTRFENLGIDPRQSYVENQIWESVVSLNPFLSREKNKSVIGKAASDFLNSSVPYINNKILLSDGNEYFYSLSRITIDAVSHPEGEEIGRKLESFLNENGIKNRSRVLLLLRGLIAGNSYFEQNLSPGFSNTIITDRRLRDNIMKLIISEEIPVTPTPFGPVSPPPPHPVDIVIELKRKWRKVKASANGKLRCSQPMVALQILIDFRSECQAASGTECIINEINREIDKINNNARSPVGVKSLEREWREVSAKAKAMVRKKSYAKASSLIKAFLNSFEHVAETKEIEEKASDLLSQIPTGRGERLKSPLGASEPNGLNGSNKSDSDREVQEYIRKGMLKEARDWYRSRNNNEMEQTLTKIIRSQRSVERRKIEIEECRKLKNMDQINRVIKEIQDYIYVCEKVGISTVGYKKVLSEYSKLLK